MNDAEEVKKRLNIAEVISGYVRLIPAGANKKALCPFHNEHSPSFTVNEEKQIFHCFGCGKGGDVFTFVQEMEGIDFVEALKMLAERAGVTLERGNFKPSADKKEAREILKEALVFFEKTLAGPQGEEAREYLKYRQVPDKLAEEFRLGFAPAGWSGLTDYLATKGIAKREAQKSGLVLESAKRPGSFYDRFRARIMFPIFDGFDNPIGFSGRVLPGDDSMGGKYINTPQTEVYDKSQALYGLNLAKQEIKKQKFSLILEGNLDVVLSHKAEVRNAVATCGTALTKDQLRILRRYADSVFLAFDNDEAGLKAAEKGLDLALAEGMEAGAVSLVSAGQGVKDVADLVGVSAEAWKKLVKKRRLAMSYYFNKEKENLNKGGPKKRKEAANFLLGKIALLGSQIDQAHYLKRLAGKLGVKEEILYEEMAKLFLTKKHFGPVMPEPQKQAESADGIMTGVLTKLLNRLAALVLFYPDLAGKEEKKRLLRITKKSGPVLAAQIIETVLKAETRFSKPERYLELLGDEKTKTQAQRLVLIAETRFNAYNEGRTGKRSSPDEDFGFCLGKVEKVFLENELKELALQLKTAETNKDADLEERLFQKYALLLKEKTQMEEAGREIKN